MRAISQDNESVVFESISPRGRYDGIILHKTEKISRYEYGTKYCDKIEKLIKHHKTELKGVKFFGKDLVAEVIEYAKKTRAIANISLFSSSGQDSCDMLGFIERVNGEWLTINGINPFGEPDGFSTAKISDIVCISLDCENDLSNKILYELKQKIKP